MKSILKLMNLNKLMKHTQKTFASPFKNTAEEEQEVGDTT